MSQSKINSSQNWPVVGLGAMVSIGAEVNLGATVSLGAIISLGFLFRDDMKLGWLYSYSRPLNSDRPWIQGHLGAMVGLGLKSGNGASNIFAWSLRSHALKHLSARFARTLRPSAFDYTAIKATGPKTSSTTPSQHISGAPAKISAS